MCIWDDPVTGLARPTLLNILKMRRASSNLYGDGAKWLSIYQHPDCKRFFRELLECYTSPQQRVVNLVPFSTEEDPRSTPMLPVLEVESSRQQDQICGRVCCSPTGWPPPPEHDRLTDSIHWSGQVWFHYKSHLWSGYATKRATISFHETCSTLDTALPLRKKEILRKNSKCLITTRWI